MSGVCVCVCVCVCVYACLSYVLGWSGPGTEASETLDLEVDLGDSMGPLCSNIKIWKGLHGSPTW